MFVKADETGVLVKTTNADNSTRFASFGVDADCFEASTEDVKEYAGKSSLGFADVLSLFAVCGYSPEHLEFLGLKHKIKRR
jgi:hypothetical protein